MSSYDDDADDENDDDYQAHQSDDDKAAAHRECDDVNRMTGPAPRAAASAGPPTKRVAAPAIDESDDDFQAHRVVWEAESDDDKAAAHRECDDVNCMTGPAPRAAASAGPPTKRVAAPAMRPSESSASTEASRWAPLQLSRLNRVAQQKLNEQMPGTDLAPSFYNLDCVVDLFKETMSALAEKHGMGRVYGDGMQVSSIEVCNLPNPCRFEEHHWRPARNRKVMKADHKQHARVLFDMLKASAGQSDETSITSITQLAALTGGCRWNILKEAKKQQGALHMLHYIEEWMDEVCQTEPTCCCSPTFSSDSRFLTEDQ